MRIFFFAGIALLLFGFHSSPVSSTGWQQDLVIMLERGSDVFRIRPAYRISIFADGTVIFDGKERTKTKGPLHTKIGKEELSRLLAEFERIHFSSLRNHYSAAEDGCGIVATDESFAVITLSLRNKTKSIEHYYGCWERDPPNVVFPQELFKLETMIDEVTNSKQWLE